jgi:Rap1a immunity proteins
MTKPAIIIVALLTMNVAAQSQTTGDQWITLCAKGVSALERASCESYARGVADAVLVVQRFSTDMPPICIPPGATGSDLAALALPYLEGQPADARKVVASALLMDAFRAAFPCQRK